MAIHKIVEPTQREIRFSHLEVLCQSYDYPEDVSQISSPSIFKELRIDHRAFKNPTRML